MEDWLQALSIFALHCALDPGVKPIDTFANYGGGTASG
jgi:hypothetical protein